MVALVQAETMAKLRGGESQAMHQGSIRFALDQTAAARVHVGVFSRLLATSRAHMPPAYV
ncbi:hypothetical protein X753_20005 [Mesorhizobium sp. LNJC399B00]|nr:hypothetical protein X753_20005 [Mesorhizobium sp. LNJC399B00]